MFAQTQSLIFIRSFLFCNKFRTWNHGGSRETHTHARPRGLAQQFMLQHVRRFFTSPPKNEKLFLYNEWLCCQFLALGSLLSSTERKSFKLGKTYPKSSGRTFQLLFFNMWNFIFCEVYEKVLRNDIAYLNLYIFYHKAHKCVTVTQKVSQFHCFFLRLSRLFFNFACFV